MAAEEAAGDPLVGLLFQLGGGGVLGFAAGYAAKKLLKLILIVVGIFTMGLLALEYKGWISIHYDAIARSIEEALTGAAGSAASLKSHILANVPFAGSFLLGFALGFKMG